MNIFLTMFICSLFAFFMTTLGSSFVYIFKNTNKKTMDICLSIAAGIMLSSSIFSLLIPALTYNNNYILLSLSILFGSLFILIIGRITLKKYNVKNKNTLLLILSIVLHNIPEGASIGICFGSLLLGEPLSSAISFSIGIALQNMPEGSSISIPLRINGNSKNKSFLIGMLSGIVEPISAVLGFIFVSIFKSLLPLFLSFAAGSMIFVIISEMIPESINDDNKNITSICFILGFLIMLILEKLI